MRVSCMSLLAVCCLFSFVCSSLFVVCCSLFVVVCCFLLLHVVRGRLLFVDSWFDVLMCVVRCLFSAVRYVSSFVACCMLHVVC